MAKTSSKNEDFEKIQDKLIKRFSIYSTLHTIGEATTERMNRYNLLNEMSKNIYKVAAMGRPDLIMDIERVCQRFDLGHFAENRQEKNSMITSLLMLRSVQEALKVPADPEKFRADLIEDFGEQNMDKFVSAPQDLVHFFVKSQTKKLGRYVSPMASPPEQGYVRARKEALKIALKIHKKNCNKALGLESKKTDRGR